MKRRRPRIARSACEWCAKMFFHRAASQPRFCGTGCARLAYLDGERAEGEALLRGGGLPRESAATDPYSRRLAKGFAILAGEEQE